MSFQGVHPKDSESCVKSFGSAPTSKDKTVAMLSTEQLASFFGEIAQEISSTSWAFACRRLIQVVWHFMKLAAVDPC
jgi:hypothetical protein